MSGFALLWEKTLRSSLWVKESKETRLLWFTLLMLKNSEGIVQSSVIGLADAAKITLKECQVSLKVLISPDPLDSSKVEEGRRIREVAGGWQIVNHDLYRFSTEAKRAFWAATKAEQRANAQTPKPRRKRSRKPKGPGAVERLAEKLDREGKPEEAQRVVELDSALREVPDSGVEVKKQ
jgi:hypothetical protein